MAKSEEKDQVFYLTESEYWSDIKDEYIQRIADMDPNDVYPSNNPGPTKPDGSVNFECHCVGHLVASPCGYEFREAITCQKASTEEELEAGACGDQLLAFMECAMRTQCFKRSQIFRDVTAFKKEVCSGSEGRRKRQ
ncbi:CHCH domain protein [Ancylostoma ceylanicum]|uniref:CHCH domain protein n=1 Tax=Ancylostoma ceylanicum TaxID=53326 RepID=A0A0D6L9H4_9BILA|nr:CHCH domain protein [Ancylostoma ceylanicum]